MVASAIDLIHRPCSLTLGLTDCQDTKGGNVIVQTTTIALMTLIDER